MRSIDIHAHLTPQCFIRAMQTGKVWHGIQPGTMRIAPRAIWTPEQRLADMNSLGVDVHVLSTGAAFYYYDGEATTVAAMHRECNDEVYQMTIDYPDRFKGLAQLPRQDPATAIAEPDRAVTFASFVFGGVMDKCPDLKICLAHGGGYTCYGIGRMDRGWQVRSEARINIQQPPSAYLKKFYYDCLTHSEAALRYLIDTVGVDRVVFGTDWPADMAIDWPVSWVLSLESLTQAEKEAILWKNLEKLLGI